MNKISWIIIAIIGVLVLWSVSGYNKLVSLDEGINSTWSDVETQYQRRYDLIPNLVEVVKGYAEHEQETLTGVVEARAKATQMTIDPSKATAAQMQQFQAAQGELTQALSRLMVTVERYPDLKANQNFLELQSQLEGTENRIAVARNRFVEGVKNYNSYRRKIPQVFIASFAGFDERAYFEADKEANEAPKVDF